MPSEAVQALSNEIDAAVESLTIEQAAGTELVKEEVSETGDVSGETGVAPGEEKSENVAEETEETEETAVRDEVGGEVVEGEATEETAEPTTPEISSDTLERAVAAGIPVADANALKPDSLERVIAAREQAYAEQEAREQDSQFLAEKAKEKKAEKEEADPFDQLPKLDPEKYEPEVIAAVEGLKDIARTQQKEISDYQDRAETDRARQDRANDQEMEQWFDGQVESLGKDFVESLGEGNYRGLNQRSMQFINRAAIVEKMSVMDSGYRVQEIQPPSREELFDAAARLVLKDKYAELTEQKIAKDLKKQSKQHIQRSAGSGKTSSKLTPQEEAAAVLDAKYFN